MKDSADHFGIKVTEIVTGNAIDDVNIFKDYIANKEEIEGVVIRFEDSGLMYKFKTNWYFKRAHKVVKKLVFFTISIGSSGIFS